MKLKRNEKRALLAIFLGFVGTGVLLYVFAHWIRVTTAIGEEHHPAEIWLRAMHSTFSYAGLIGLGYLIPRHVLPGFKGERKLRSGLGNLTLLALLILSALGILYSGNEAWNSAFAQAHSWLGFALPVSLLIHLYKRKKIRR